MCEVWKWIIIVTAVPLGVTWFFGDAITNRLAVSGVVMTAPIHTHCCATQKREK